MQVVSGVLIYMLAFDVGRTPRLVSDAIWNAVRILLVVASS